MPQTYQQQVEDDMQAWFADLQRKKVAVSGVPKSAPIKTEIIRLTEEQYNQFVKNPQQFVIDSSTRNSNAISDPLFG